MLVLFFGLMLAYAPADDDPEAPWTFVDRAAEGGLTFRQQSGTPEQRTIVEVKSTGAALLDVDRDGLLDLFLAAGSTVERHLAGVPGYGCRLYRNLGNFRFEDVTTAVGLPAFDWASGVAAADVDGNGWDDLLVTGYGADRLFLNRGGRLEETTEFAGLGESGWSTSAAFADLDGDGDLDLYIAGYLEFDFKNPPTHGPTFSCLWRNRPVVCGPRGLPPRRDSVYENLGSGRFRDVTEAWGFAEPGPRYGLGVLIADLVGDPRPDIYVANDASLNFLFENRGTRFVDVGFLAGVSASEDGEEQAGMGVDAIDLDDNGRLDIVVTNFENERNNLYLASGTAFFEDRADAWGLGRASHRYLSWGAGFYDFNNDGVIDLFVANGHVYRQAEGVAGVPGYAQRDHLYVGSIEASRRVFSERGRELGFSAAHTSRGAAFGDLDNDGDVDIVVCHLNEVPGVYENRSPPRHRALALTLRQDGSNPQAIGARVDVRAGGVRRVTEVRRQASFQCSHDPRVHIGLGVVSSGAVVRVRWPGGDGATWETFTIPANTPSAVLERGAGDVADPEVK